MRLIILLIVSIVLVHGYKNYTGYTVWRTKPLTNETIQPVLTLLENFTKFSSFLPRFVGHKAFIMSTPEHVNELLDELNLHDLQPELYVENVQTLIDQERSEIAETKTDLAGNVTFDSLMQLHEIDAYLDTVVQTYPEMTSLEVIGHSLEGRAMRVLKISKNDNNTRPAVFMDAGIHAREWSAPPVALYVVQQLTTVETSMLDLADWYILPVVNPDGYVYSWNEDRFWRKNRRKVEGSDCVGIDLNRNFDIHFGKGSYARSACWSSYPGTHAFSEPEAEAIGNFLTNLSGRLSLYMSIHCPGPFLLQPYGFTRDPAPEKVIRAAEAAIIAVNAVRGANYTTASIPNIKYLAYGSSQDFAMEVAGAPYAYTWEITAHGKLQFLVPMSEILPAVQETWQGIKTLAHHALIEIYNQSK